VANRCNAEKGPVTSYEGVAIKRDREIVVKKKLAGSRKLGYQ